MKAVEIRTNTKGWSDVHLSADGLCLTSNTDSALGLEPDSRYAVVAVKLPDGYRLATEEDESSSVSVRGCFWPDNDGLDMWDRCVVGCASLGTHSIYAVPITPPAPVIKITVDGTEVTLSDETVAAIREAVAK